MAVLVLLQGGQAVPYPLDGDEILIGRHPDCGVQLDSSPVSRRHARALIKHARYLTQDLGSGNRPEAPLLHSWGICRRREAG